MQKTEKQGAERTMDVIDLNWQSEDRQTPPGYAEEYFVTVQKLGRSAKDRFAFLYGVDPVASIRHAFAFGIKDFRLPTKDGKGVTKGQKDDEVFEALPADLAEWMFEQVVEFNHLLPEQVLAQLKLLGNSTPPAAEEDAEAGEDAQTTGSLSSSSG
jgi:hypothetical protein